MRCIFWSVFPVLAAGFKKGLGRIPKSPTNLAAHLLRASLKSCENDPLFRSGRVVVVSAKAFCSLPVDGPSISVANLKLRIFHSKGYGKGRDFDLTVMNAQTNEEYVDDTVMIPKGTSVLIRRMPWPKGKSIVVGEPYVYAFSLHELFLELPLEQLSQKVQKIAKMFTQSGTSATESSSYKFPDESDSCDFEEAFSAIHNEVADQPSNQVLSRSEEDRRIKALVDTPAIDWQSQPKDVYYSEGSTGRAWGGRVACGFGDGLVGFKKPPAGYICHRCKMPAFKAVCLNIFLLYGFTFLPCSKTKFVCSIPFSSPGHFIQHCPTNGDPNFDIKKMKPATGIPRSMLLAAPDGSYSLPDGVAAVLKPNESVFEKEIEGIPSVCRVSDLPPELNCPLCKKVMKDAVMSSKCCFASFCDKCIRDHIITKSMCICGAKHLVADDLIPNVTLRETIDSFLVISSRSGSVGSSDTGSAASKALSPVFSVASVSRQKASPPTVFVVFVHQIVVMPLLLMDDVGTTKDLDVIIQH
ncbi:DWNN [Musa troglodytarum]|uniref:DWNN n=1 Tax=Musa troglodytarum TaxID=320322 RepID=A0A9E7HZQ4_9LILI|nr:DWNN [Musa troglodytarum]